MERNFNNLVESYLTRQKWQRENYPNKEINLKTKSMREIEISNRNYKTLVFENKAKHWQQVFLDGETSSKLKLEVGETYKVNSKDCRSVLAKAIQQDARKNTILKLIKP